MTTAVKSIGRVQIIAQGLLKMLRTLARDLPNVSANDSEWSFARESLEALPLTTETMGVASNRLANARDYSLSREVGAANFELRQLSRMIEQLCIDS
jgi:hypothetical protein